MSDETLQYSPETKAILEAIAEVEKRINGRMDKIEEDIRLQSMSADSRFDRLESIALEAKSISLMARSQMTILTEEVRAWSKEIHQLQSDLTLQK